MSANYRVERVTVTVAWLSVESLTQGTWKLDLTLRSVMVRESDMLEADHFVSKTSATDLQTWDLVSVYFHSGGRKTEEVCLPSKKKAQQIYSINLPENKSIPITVNLTLTIFHIIPWDRGFILNSQYPRAQCEPLYLFLSLKTLLKIAFKFHIESCTPGQDYYQFFFPEYSSKIYYSLFLNLRLLVVLSCLSRGTY